jgi:hypothetical protein
VDRLLLHGGLHRALQGGRVAGRVERDGERLRQRARHRRRRGGRLAGDVHQALLAVEDVKHLDRGHAAGRAVDGERDRLVEVEELGGGVGRDVLDRDRDADLLELALDLLGQGVIGAGLGGQRDAQALGVAGLREQLLGQARVVRVLVGEL